MRSLQTSTRPSVGARARPAARRGEWGLEDGRGEDGRTAAARSLLFAAAGDRGGRSRPTPRLPLMPPDLPVVRRRTSGRGRRIGRFEQGKKGNRRLARRAPPPPCGVACGRFGVRAAVCRSTARRRRIRAPSGRVHCALRRGVPRLGGEWRRAAGGNTRQNRTAHVPLDLSLTPFISRRRARRARPVQAHRHHGHGHLLRVWQRLRHVLRQVSEWGGWRGRKKTRAGGRSARECTPAAIS